MRDSRMLSTGGILLRFSVLLLVALPRGVPLTVKLFVDAYRR